MCSFTLHSKRSWVILFFLSFCFYFGESCISAGQFTPAKYDGFCIGPADSDRSRDVRWANYLYDHLERRKIEDRCVITKEPSDDHLLQISIALDTTNQRDFEIRLDKKGLQLIARDDEKMLWLQYQLMKNIGMLDKRIDASDLPPAVLDFDQDTSGNFAFEYRGIYSPTNHNADYRGIMATDDVEDGWGIWGHQLGRFLGTKDPAVLATVNGEKTSSQYCFTSKSTFEAISNYIIDHFGMGESQSMRFVIAPEDNQLVCLCDGCRQIGNRDKNATPAVAHLIEKLAHAFPLHEFFLLSYLTSEIPPKSPLPSNVGVMISTIDLPFIKHIDQSVLSKDFVRSVDRWKLVTSKIYVWDYINNFDDYLTPFPVLRLLSERLQFFRTLGVKGVFLNGSGYDYCIFDDLRTCVFAALLVNPNLNVETLIRDFYQDKYPHNYSLLSDYVIDLENSVKDKHPGLSLYGSIRNAEQTYFDPARFVRFFDELRSALVLSKGDERKELHKLYTALCYTRLEIARNYGISELGFARVDNNKLYPCEKIHEWLNALEEHRNFVGMMNISESELAISSYIKAWRQLLQGLPSRSNLLKRVTVKQLSPSEDGFNRDVSILTDCAPGFSIGYHYGWYISPDDVMIEIPAKDISRATHFKMNFLNIPRHRIYPPKLVEIYKNDVLYKSFPPTSKSTDPICSIEGAVDMSDGAKISIKIVRTNGERSQFATDEIYFIP